MITTQRHLDDVFYLSLSLSLFNLVSSNVFPTTLNFRTSHRTQSSSAISLRDKEDPSWSIVVPRKLFHVPRCLQLGMAPSYLLLQVTKCTTFCLKSIFLGRNLSVYFSQKGISYSPVTSLQTRHLHESGVFDRPTLGIPNALLTS